MSTQRIPLLIALLLLWSITGLGQSNNMVPLSQYAPTPKALEMTRYGHMPPDLNSGIYSYDIPIYTYKDKYFNIPISLHYSSSGFQPAKMSDEAGLHWTLMAGGAITREIVGVDDFDLTYGLLNNGVTDVNDSTLYYVIKPSNWTGSLFKYCSNNVPSISGSQECSSDRYHFSFPGHSGSFVMDFLGQNFIVYGTEAGKGLYDIEWNSISMSFTIKTGNGYSYRFGSSDNAREVNWSRHPVLPGEQAVSLQDVNRQIVTWLLDEITAPDGSKMTFEYSSNRMLVDIPQANNDVMTSFSRRKYKVNEDLNGGGSDCYKLASLTFTSYLSRIEVQRPLNDGRNLEIDFYWSRSSSTETNDEEERYTQLVVPRRHLDSIDVKLGNDVIRHATMTYENDGKRPLLTNVDISGLGSYSMTYWTDPNNPLPGILTNSLDLWGYYNGGTATDQQVCPMNIDSRMDEEIEQRYMDPSWQHARLGLLKTITYPTGGTTTITYESNKAQKVLLRRGSSGIQPADPELGDPYGPTDLYLPDLYNISILDSPFVPDCGGVRVKTLSDYDGQNTIDHSYTYSGGIVQQFPRYFSGKIGQNPLWDPHIRFPGSSFDQRHVAYTSVTEHFPDSSKIVTTFSSWEDEPDEYSEHRQWLTGEAYHDYPAIQAFLDNILREPDSRAYRRGRPIRRETYDGSGNKKCDEVWTYTDVGNGYRSYAVTSGQFAWTARTFICDRKPQTYVRTEWLDDARESITETTTYTYNSLGQLKSTSVHSGGHTVVKTSTYPADISEGVYPSMTAAQYMSFPVEQTVTHNGKVTEASLTTYYQDQSTNMYLPRESYRANLGNGVPSEIFTYYSGTTVGGAYDKYVYFKEYDSHGNILESRDRADVPTRYVWDSDNHLSAAFVGASEGTRDYYIRGAIPHTETQLYVLADEILENFTAETAGSFSFTFAPQDTTHLVFAFIDGNSLTVQRLGGGIQGTASPVTVTAGSHTFRMYCPDSPLFPRGGGGDVVDNSPDRHGGDLPPIITYPMTGQLSITYPWSGAVSAAITATDCVFLDFESTGGTSGYGFHSPKGRTSTYSNSYGLITGRAYVLDYMRRDNGEWHYVREVFTATTRPMAISIEASQSSPIDHVRIYPTGVSASSYTWWPTGELRCAVDGSGYLQTYEYDSLGRLVKVRDHEGNIVNQYNYHYVEVE